MAKAQRVGVRAEKRVADDLRKHGAEVELSPASQGAADLKAWFPGNRKWYVQVKGAVEGEPERPSGEELRRLKIAAKLADATPVVALVHGNGDITYESARNGRRLQP